MRNCEYEQYEPSQIDEKKTILEQLLVIKSIIKNNYPFTQIYFSNIPLTQNYNISYIKDLGNRNPKENDLVLYFEQNNIQYGIVENLVDGLVTFQFIKTIGGSSEQRFYDLNFLSDIALEASADGIEFNGTVNYGNSLDTVISSNNFKMQIPIIGSNKVSVDLNENNDKVKISLTRNRLGRHFVVISGTHNNDDNTTFEINLTSSFLDMTTGNFNLIYSYERLKSHLSNRNVYSLGANVIATGYIKDKDDINWNIESLYYDEDADEVLVKCYSIEFAPTTNSFSLNNLNNITYKDNIQNYNLGD